MFICHKKMKNVNIMGVHQFLGEGIGGGGGPGGVTKDIYGELPQNGGFNNLEGAWQEISTRVFLREAWYLNANCDLILVHTATWDRTRWCEATGIWSVFPVV